MARLPYVDPEQASAPVREAFARLPVHLNIFRTMAHAETCFRPLLRLGSAILGGQRLDARLRELAILRVAALSKARYEWEQHVPIARAAGVRAEQIAALERGEASGEEFSPLERAVLDFTTEVVEQVRASEVTFGRLAAELSAQEIVELLVAIGFYMMIARIAETVDVDLDEPAGDRVAEAARSET